MDKGCAPANVGGATFYAPRPRTGRMHNSVIGTFVRAELECWKWDVKTISRIYFWIEIPSYPFKELSLKILSLIERFPSNIEEILVQSSICLDFVQIKTVTGNGIEIANETRSRIEREIQIGVSNWTGMRI
ncbi:hypothetical protein EVAR_53431_1 [Eumeta japonica]|uniref:Uncharacterized protein n=1 Tax=Eumeta variegata TaxID=151549 RepID=A0A4C1Y2Z6_EUMVA|nr:hypothetical protein EVAR_53431_1 [Eumeta japonica]